MKISLPFWLRKPKIQLPEWAKVVESPRVQKGQACISIEADPNGFYPEWLDLLGVERPDRYWLEVAYQCAKMDLQMALEGTEWDPRAIGKHAEFHFTRADAWKLDKYPNGKGVKAASQGKEAREHYKRIRGRLPF